MDVAEVESFFEQLINASEKKPELWDNFGYVKTEEITPEKLRQAYDRGDIVRALIDARPEATWSGRNELLLDGQPDDDLNDLARRYRLWSVFQRADLASEITGCSVIMVPGPDLSAPPSPEELDRARLAVWGRDDITWDSDAIGPDGYPETYRLIKGAVDVDASRCLHVADPRHSKSYLVGNPRLISGWNRIVDWNKTVGGGGEGFLQAALPRYHLEYENPPTPEQRRNAFRRLQLLARGKIRSIATTAIKVQQLLGTAPRFSQNGDFLIKVLAAAWRVPLTEVTSEALVAHSAETNLTVWHSRMDERRYEWAEVEVVAPGVAWIESIRTGNGGMRGPDQRAARLEAEARIGVRWSPWDERFDQQPASEPSGDDA